MSPHARLGIVAFAAVGGVFLLCGGAVALLVMKRTPGGGPAVSLFGPSESRAGKEWTHKDLADHLRAKGLKLELEEREERGQANAVADFNFREMKLVEDWRYSRVTVTKMPTPEEARDKAGTSDDSYAWGRFLFKGPSVFIARIRKALS